MGMRGMNSDDEKKPLNELDPKLFIRLGSFVKPYTVKMLISILCMLMTSATSLIAPTLLRYAIDYGMVAQNLVVINQIVIVYVLAYTANWFFTYWQTYLMSKVGQDTVSYTHLRAHETRHDLVCRLLLE